MINEVKWFDETKPTGCSTLSGLDQRVEWIDGGLRTPQNLRKRALISQKNLNKKKKKNLNTMNHTKVLRELVFGFFAKANE